MSKPYSFIKTFSILALSSLFIFCINTSDKGKNIASNPNSTSTLDDDKKKLLTEANKLMLSKAQEIKEYAENNNYNSELCFLVDMNLHSGLKRFFVYDLIANEVLYAGLMAHGSCNENYLKDAKFSNKPSCGCSSLGKYSIGGKYVGKYGTAYKLYGLDSSNSNAYKRNIVLHAFSSVPDEETYPRPICNSLGCPMVSSNFFYELTQEIDNSPKQMLLYMYR